MNRIYGTIFNNRKYLPGVMASLKGLRPYKVYVVDNFSTDGSYEYLKVRKDTVVVRDHCSRGIGRDVALKMVVSEGNKDDLLIMLDFDGCLKPDFYRVVKWARKNLRQDEIINFSTICRLKTARKLRYVDLNYGEDNEFVAYAYSKLKGRKIYLDDSSSLRANPGRGITNNFASVTRYSNGYKAIKRAVRAVVESHRGIAYKRWSGEAKTPSLKLANIIGHFIAKFEGVYSYSEKYANNEYIQIKSTHRLIITKHRLILKRNN
jgi:glycosyltransferase involved in cell wall biosynthesis